MALIVQPSLFGFSGTLGAAELGSTLERRQFSDGAWIDLRPGFITAADELFDALVTAVPWREDGCACTTAPSGSRGSWPATGRARPCHIPSSKRLVRRSTLTMPRSSV